MPDLSRIAPISTNSGTASNVESLIAPNQRAGSVLSVAGSNEPVMSPRKANASAVEAKENATL